MNHKASVNVSESTGAADPERVNEAEIVGGIPLLFFAFRSLTRRADERLSTYGLGRAHFRAMHILAGVPGATVSDLLDLLGVTNQAIGRVLARLQEDGLVVQKVDSKDRRLRRLYLTENGVALERETLAVQAEQLQAVIEEVGPAAYRGYLSTLAALVSPEDEERLRRFQRDSL